MPDQDEVFACTCPHCNARLTIPRELAGMKGRCSFCKKKFVAPTPLYDTYYSKRVSATKRSYGLPIAVGGIVLVLILGVASWMALRGFQSTKPATKVVSDATPLDNTPSANSRAADPGSESTPGSQANNHGTKRPQPAPERAEGRVFVDGSLEAGGSGEDWAHALTRLEDAVRVEGVQGIWIAKGVYHLNGLLDVPADCELIGGFAGGEHSREEQPNTYFVLSGSLRMAHGSSIHGVEIADDMELRFLPVTQRSASLSLSGDASALMLGRPGSSVGSVSISGGANIGLDKDRGEPFAGPFSLSKDSVGYLDFGRFRIDFQDGAATVLSRRNDTKVRFAVKRIVFTDPAEKLEGEFTSGVIRFPASP